MSPKQLREKDAICRCTATTKSGQRCRNFTLIGEDKCVMHSQSEMARHARRRRRILTKEEMILELQRQLRSVKRSEASPLEKSREIRTILNQISDLKGEKPPREGEPESGKTFEEKLDKWKKKEESPQS